MGLRRYQRGSAYRQHHRWPDHPDADPFRSQWLRLRARPPQRQTFESEQIRPVHQLAKEIDLKTGRPVLNPDKETHEDVNVKEICPAAQGAKNHQPASYDPRTKLFYVGTNHICMDYQAFGVKY